MVVRESSGADEIAPRDRRVAKNFSGRPIPAKAKKREPASRSPATGARTAGLATGNSCPRSAPGTRIPLRCRAARGRRRGQGRLARPSRNGPAGITRPLPNRRPASTTTRDKVLGDRLGFETRHRGGSSRPPPRPRRGLPAARSRATQQGADGGEQQRFVTDRNRIVASRINAYRSRRGGRHNRA